MPILGHVGPATLGRTRWAGHVGSATSGGHVGPDKAGLGHVGRSGGNGGRSDGAGDAARVGGRVATRRAEERARGAALAGADRLGA